MSTALTALLLRSVPGHFARPRAHPITAAHERPGFTSPCCPPPPWMCGVHARVTTPRCTGRPCAGTWRWCAACWARGRTAPQPTRRAARPWTWRSRSGRWHTSSCAPSWRHEGRGCSGDDGGVPSVGCKETLRSCRLKRRHAGVGDQTLRRDGCAVVLRAALTSCIARMASYCKSASVASVLGMCLCLSQGQKSPQRCQGTEAPLSETLSAAQSVRHLGG